jgi:hypothetical protein
MPTQTADSATDAPTSSGIGNCVRYDALAQVLRLESGGSFSGASNPAYVLMRVGETRQWFNPIPADCGDPTGFVAALAAYIEANGLDVRDILVGRCISVSWYGPSMKGDAEWMFAQAAKQAGVEFIGLEV